MDFHLDLLLLPAAPVAIIRKNDRPNEVWWVYFYTRACIWAKQVELFQTHV